MRVVSHIRKLVVDRFPANHVNEEEEMHMEVF